MEHPPSDAPLPLTDRLAIDRTLLANERTLLAYIRTAIMFGVSAVTLIKFFPQEHAVQVFGWSLFPLTIFVAAIGIWRFLRVSRRLKDSL